MSILQDYEKHNKLLGEKKEKAIQKYLQSHQALLYSDVIYKKTEWAKFENWYKKSYNKKHEGDTKNNSKIHQRKGLG